MKEPIILIVTIASIAFIIAAGVKKFISKSVDTSPSTFSFEEKHQLMSEHRERQDQLRRDQQDFKRQYEQQMRDFKRR